MKLSFLLFLVVVVGCASNSGVVPMGEGKYMISRQAASGFSGLGILKSEAVREAGVYCSGQKKSVRILESNESAPPYIFGNFPRVEIQFSCSEGT